MIIVKSTLASAESENSEFLFGLLVAGIRHTAGEQQRVDGRLSDQQQERPIGEEHAVVQVDGASDRHDGRGSRCLAAFLIYLQTRRKWFSLTSCVFKGSCSVFGWSKTLN